MDSHEDTRHAAIGHMKNGKETTAWQLFTIGFTIQSRVNNQKEIKINYLLENKKLQQIYTQNKLKNYLNTQFWHENLIVVFFNN